MSDKQYQDSHLVALDIDAFKPAKIRKLSTDFVTSDAFDHNIEEIEEIHEFTNIVCTPEDDCIEEDHSYREPSKLDKILDNQCLIINALQNLESRIACLEDDIKEVQFTTNDDNKSVRECKEILKRVHQSVCRITGETEDYHIIAIASMLPLSSMEAIAEMEDKLHIKENVMLLKSFVFKTKGNNGSIDHVMRQLFTDEVIYLFNYDGKCNKKVLKDLKIIDGVLYDVFSSLGKCEFEKGLKKFIELSHNRLKSKKNRRKKM